MRTVSTTDTTMTFSVRELAGVPVDSLDAERLSIGMELVQAVTERVIWVGPVTVYHKVQCGVSSLFFRSHAGGQRPKCFASPNSSPVRFEGGSWAMKNALEREPATRVE